jgi:hypothetical protein
MWRDRGPAPLLQTIPVASCTVWLGLFRIRLEAAYE